MILVSNLGIAALIAVLASLFGQSLFSWMAVSNGGERGP
jgi:hypothetical protein